VFFLLIPYTSITLRVLILAGIYFGGWPTSEILLNFGGDLIGRMIDFLKFGG